MVIYVGIVLLSTNFVSIFLVG